MTTFVRYDVAVSHRFQLMLFYGLYFCSSICINTTNDLHMAI